MEVPMINRISDFEVDPSFLSRSVAVSGIGKLHQQAYGFWKWGALIIAIIAYFTGLITKFKSLILNLRKIDVTITPPTLFDDYDTETDVSSASPPSSDDEEDEEDEDDVDSIYNRRDFSYFNEQGQNGIFTCFGGSFGDLFSWPDLGGIGSSGLVKLWDHLDIDGDDNDNGDDQTNSFFLTAVKKGTDGVKVEACDPRVGFRMPAMLAEWKQPGRLFGNIIGVDVGGVEKVYIRDDVNGKIAVGDLRRFNDVLTDTDDENW